MAHRFSNKKKKGIDYFDYSLLFVVLFLLGFGLVMIYSTSSYQANIKFGVSTYYLRKQAIATIIGLVAMFIVAKIDYHIWEKFAIIAFVGSVVLIILVVTPLGMEKNGARRWLNLGMSLQPAEVAKLGIVIFLASLICKLGKKIKSIRGFAIVTLPPLFVSGLIYFITKNLSSAIIVMGIAVIMVFVASPDYKKFIIIGILGLLAAAGLVYLLVKMSEGGAAGGLSFRGARVLAWLDPEAYASGKGFQTLQSLYAIGSGGVFGKGIGQSMQKLGFIPEAQNDMIFSIICEELGLFGAFAIILLFVLLIWRCMIIANNAPDLLGAMLVVGILGHFALQVILNIAVVTNTIPNTGITLPFISYGGSSTLFLLSEIGLVLSVAKGIRFKDT